MPLETKKGLINKDGIVADKDLYSCQLAIKEQWFLKVFETGPIEVDVYMDSANPEEIFLPLSVGYVSCQRIPRYEIRAENQEAYFAQLNRIKHRLKERPKP